MIGLSIFAKGVFQVPFFSIVVEEVLKWIMANIAALEESQAIKRIAGTVRTYIIVDITIAARWTRDNLRRCKKMFTS
jgi:hypothetical protein